jgi:hypothetical protein
MSTQSVPVAPDAVRVWRGFRLPGLSQDQFFAKLGSIFIPGTVQIQAPVGLTAYLPSVLPREKHPAAPDEIALVFYRVQQSYDDAKKTVGGRAYSDLHGLVFDLSRSLSGFPEKFAGELVAGGRYHLFDQPLDWQRGAVNAFVGVRSGGDPGEFIASVADWLGEVQRQGGPDGAIASVATDYVVYWEHWPDEAAAAGSPIPGLAERVEPVYRRAFQPTPMHHGLWESYDGLTVAGGESFNFQFERHGA